MTLATRLNGVLAVVGTIPSGVGPDLLCGELRTDNDQPWHLSSIGNSVTACLRLAPNTEQGLTQLLDTLSRLAKKREGVGHRAGRPISSEVIAELGKAVDAKGLTLRQRHILAMIMATVDGRGYPPSIREIGDAVGLSSSSSVAHQLERLQTKGFLHRDPQKRRALTVLIPEASK